MIKKICIYLLIFVIGPIWASAELLIITHPETKTGQIDKATTKSIFLGNKATWRDNTKISLMVFKKGEVHKEFLSKCVHKNPFQFSNYWKRQVFLGKVSTVPKLCNSVDDMVNFVTKTPGSIGYVPSNTDIKNQNIRTICVIH